MIALSSKTVPFNRRMLGMLTVDEQLKENNMQTVTSKDGTKIAYDVYGQGPAVILVDGASATRAFGGSSELAQGLAKEGFTTYIHDRRRRGESGDTQPYAVAREIEDIEALIDVAGGTANLYGISSGGALALEAAAVLGKKVNKIFSLLFGIGYDVVVRDIGDGFVISTVALSIRKGLNIRFIFDAVRNFYFIIIGKK